MQSLLDPLLMVLLLLNVFSLGTGRIRAIIHATALQGILLGVMPLLVVQALKWHLLAVVAVTIALKGLIIPTMLRRAMREVAIRREVEPLIGQMKSMAIAGAFTAFFLVQAQRLPVLPSHSGGLVVPASLSTILTGFLLMTTRRKAITQVLGYLLLENGIFIFGLLLLDALPLLVELGVMLDLFVCIFVMGIMLNHIHQEFASLDTRHLATLKE